MRTNPLHYIFLALPFVVSLVIGIIGIITEYNNPETFCVAFAFIGVACLYPFILAKIPDYNSEKTKVFVVLMIVLSLVLIAIVTTLFFVFPNSYLDYAELYQKDFPRLMIPPLLYFGAIIGEIVFVLFAKAKEWNMVVYYFGVYLSFCIGAILGVISIPIILFYLLIKFIVIASAVGSSGGSSSSSETKTTYEIDGKDATDIGGGEFRDSSGDVWYQKYGDSDHVYRDVEVEVESDDD
ncbi:MAG: hypothetical protein WCT17_05750 [Bacilli bacterium]